MQQVVPARAGVRDLEPHIVTEIALNTKRPLLDGRNLERITSNGQANREDRRIRSAPGRVAQERVVNADALVRFGIREPVLLDYADEAAIVVDAIPAPNRHLAVRERIPGKADARTPSVVGTALDMAAEWRVVAGKDDSIEPVTAARNDGAIWIVLDRVRWVVELRQERDQDVVGVGGVEKDGMPHAKVERDVPPYFPGILRIPLIGPEAFVDGYVGLVRVVWRVTNQEQVGECAPGECPVERESSRGVGTPRVLVLGLERKQHGRLEG